MGKFFKKMRIEKGLSEEEVALAVNIPLREYICYESGSKIACNAIKYTLINFLIA